MIVETGLGGADLRPFSIREMQWREPLTGINVLRTHNVSVASAGGQRRVSVVVDGYVVSHGAKSEGFSAAETFLESYLTHEMACLRKVDGAFVCLVVDFDREIVFLANDRLGKKSGFVCLREGRFLFCSTIQELSEKYGLDLQIDRDAFFDILSLGCVPAPRSMFCGVEKLEAGTIWILKKHVEKKRYYDLSEIDACSLKTAHLAEEVRDLLLDSVKRGAGLSRHWSAFLSGGMDSSSVVWGMSREVDAFDTYYANFGSLDDYLAIPDDIAVARDVSNAFGSRHSELLIGSDAISSVPSIVSRIGEPICDGGPIVVDRVLSAASATSDAIMSGNGGDFLFGGERRHLLHMLISRSSMQPLWSIAKALRPLLPAFGPERLTRFRFDLVRSLELRQLGIAEFYAHRFNTPEEICRLLGATSVASHSSVAHVEEALAKVPEWDGLSQLLYLDLTLLSPNLILRDVNLLAESYGLTAYHPFFDTDFVEFALKLPTSSKVRGLTLKYALRVAMEGALPPSVLRKKKGGLGAPILYWLTSGNEMIEDCLSTSTVHARGLFDPKETSRMKAQTATRERDYSMLLWTAFTSELWMREFSGPRVVSEACPVELSPSEAANADVAQEFRSAI